MYVQSCRLITETIQVESYDFYRRTFNTRFKLKFHIPKKDQCDFGKSFKNIPNDLKMDDMKQAYNFHQK